MSRIRAVGIVVPARDEEDAVVACLRSVRRAADAAARRDGVATAVTVVLDRCADRTPERVAALLAGWPRAEVLVVRAVGSHRVADTAGGPVALAGAGVGALRDLGARHVLGRLGGAPPESTWLLHTDADTVVPPRWVRHHLALARAGAGGVAGLADLDADAAGLSAPARERYAAVLARGLGVGTHDHVYGANLGVRADAYLAAGGFPVDGPGEDHGLWRRLADAGVPLERSRAVRVRTSARLRGRAAGGLADLLRSLERGADDSALAGPDTGTVRHTRVQTAAAAQHVIAQHVIAQPGAAALPAAAAAAAAAEPTAAQQAAARHAPGQCATVEAGTPGRGATGQHAADRRATDQRATGQRATGQRTTVEAAATDEHAAGQHAAGQHAAGQHAVGQHAAGQRAAGRPGAGQHVVGEYGASEHGAGEQVTGQQVTGQRPAAQHTAVRTRHAVARRGPGDPTRRRGA